MAGKEGLRNNFREASSFSQKLANQTKEVFNRNGARYDVIP
jgi:hypothetical protein